jgi:cobalt/nickel transport system ATP-binding protein
MGNCVVKKDCDKTIPSPSPESQGMTLTTASRDSLFPQKISSMTTDRHAELQTPLISVDAVDFGYEGRGLLFSRLNFKLFPGEKVGLLGPNGSGKTTFLHLLMGLVAPTAGKIEIFGKQRHRPQDFRDLPGRIGLLFQDSDDQLFCPTVAEDVAFGPFNLGRNVAEVRQIVRHTLSELGLQGWEHRITYRLSGGEKRLVALATVLAMDPEILLLDEPTAGLDEAAYARVETILSRLPQAMIVVSHDRDFLRRLCHRQLNLQDGKLNPLTE